MSRTAERVRRYYLERDRAGVEDRNSLLEKPYLYTMQSLERALLGALTEAGLGALSDQRILDLGCGTGQWLGRLALYGADPAKTTGIDLLAGRAALAAERAPASAVLTADAEHLPFASASFDMVLQFVVLSSIVEDDARRHVAGEMLRVLAPGGTIISYDFIWNPLNRHTRGLRQRDYQRLFPGGGIRFRRVTLAPPIARRVAGRSFVACQVMEKLPLLRSHYLTMIRKP